jgi:DNA-directed RNA polymerase specialized sigma24 family protein
MGVLLKLDDRSMESAGEFRELLTHAATGDEHASSALFSHFSPRVLRVARMKLSSPTLRQRVDETDICQSVFSEFFAGLREGQFSVDTPEDLQRLLLDITHKCVLRQVQKHSAGKRDVRKQSELADGFDPIGMESTASTKASREELVHRFLSNLTEEDRYVVEQRKLGREWEDLAAELTTSADALRVRISRATKSAWTKLGL